MTIDNQDHNRHDQDADPHSLLAMQWHGFGSPVGWAILAVSLGITAVLVRVAILGFA
ncbi:hypothetical protein [Pelagibacterium lentulum]|uniref:Uncharacterized protein n=1 Tax=Pelagibacterium lentulum TaxID=2029865 RepID=A0A916R658_9HYPH|nr:hypothetical protein [Pelagibacterium lentulum]GGA37069.1 hypothetical protein GCM10011499_03020 [Pelagibacterium lentulum]